MQLKPHYIAAAVCLGFAMGCVPATAGTCVLLVLTGGTLGLSGDGTRLGSQEAGGLPSTFTVTSIGSSVVSVAAPTLTQSPAGYSPGSQQLEVAYSGTGVLASVSQAYTPSASAFAVPNLFSAVAVTVQNRISNAVGFAAGSYATRTVVTCS